MSKYELGSPFLKMPDSDEFLIEAWIGVGISSNNGMGMTPISWCEIESFSRQSKTDLTGWESKQLMLMSKTYCSFITTAENPNCPSPCEISLSEDDVKAQQKAISDAFRSKFKRQ